MAGYTIGSAKGKKIADDLAVGGTYKASDGSTWKKNSDGSVSVTTKNGGYTQNAYQSTVSKPTTSKTSTSSSRQTVQNPYQGTGTYNTVDDFYKANADRISGIASANNVDTATAKSMLISNLTNGTNYAGGGVGNISQLATAYKNALAAEQARPKESVMQPTNTQDALYNAFAEQQKALQHQISQAVNSIEQQKALANKTYEERMREAYIANALSQNQLGDYLSANGLSGGMAESTAMNMANQYQNNMRNANTEYGNTINQMNQLINDTRTSGNTNLANLSSDYLNRLASSLEAQRDFDYQKMIDQRNYDYMVEQDRLSNLANQQAMAQSRGGGSARSGIGNKSTAEILGMLVNGEIDENTARPYLQGTMYQDYLSSTPIQATQNNKLVTDTISSLGLQRSNNKIDNYGILTSVKAMFDNGTLTEQEAQYILTQLGI